LEDCLFHHDILHLSYHAALGWCYSEGKGQSKDESKALKLYHLSAEKLSPRGQNALGYYYRIGLPNLLEANIYESVRFLDLSAAQGYPIAHDNLGVIYRDGKGNLPIDIKKKAIYHFEIACAQNYRDSLYNLGCIHRDGYMVKKNIKEALRLFELAAEQGDDWAQAALGHIYEFGNGEIKINYPKAIEYYHLAAEKDDPFACWRLGIFSEKQGKYEKAFELYSRAVKGGREEASISLARLSLTRPSVVSSVT